MENVYPSHLKIEEMLRISELSKIKNFRGVQKILFFAVANQRFANVKNHRFFTDFQS